MPSRTARGYLSNGVNKCHGASWSEELDDKELRGVLGGDCNLELRGCAVWNIVNLESIHPSPSTSVVEYGHAKLTPNNKIDDVGDLVDDLESDWSDSVSDTSEPFVITNNGDNDGSDWTSAERPQDKCTKPSCAPGDKKTGQSAATGFLGEISAEEGAEEDRYSPAEVLENLQDRNATSILMAMEKKNRKGKKNVDVRDMKIIQLAKRSRALATKLETEKARSQKAYREVMKVTKELQECKLQVGAVSSSSARLHHNENIKGVALKPSATTDRSSHNEERLRQQVVVLRNKLFEAQEDVKKAHRTLLKEIGGTDIKLDRALNGDVGWKGRARQIVMLKARVRELECNCSSATNNSPEPAATKSPDVDSRAREDICFIERQRSHAVKQLEREGDSLRQELEVLRGQVMAKGARVAGLKKTNALLRERVKMLLTKSDTDDRLVDALRSQLQEGRDQPR